MALPRYFKRHSDEPRADEYDSWGTFDLYFEFDVEGHPRRQVEQYQNGIVVKYDRSHAVDQYGGLSDSADLSNAWEFEISDDEFERVWALEALNYPAEGRTGRTATDELITLMERFVSGEAISLADAQRLEGVILESAPAFPELEDLADDLAQYQPGGGDYLYDFEQMKPRVARQLAALRAAVLVGQLR